MAIIPQLSLFSWNEIDVKADYFFPKIAGLKFPRRTLLILLFFLLDPLFP